MVTAADCLKKYGEPSKTAPWLTYWHVPKQYQVNNFPAILWCNKDLVGPLEKALQNLLTTGAIAELCTFNGVFNIRNIRGGDTLSLHSFAIAIDLNAKDNPLGLTRKQAIAKGLTPFTDKFAKCFIDAGFDWGGNFKSRPDLQHFQLSKI